MIKHLKHGIFEPVKPTEQILYQCEIFVIQIKNYLYQFYSIMFVTFVK